MSAIITVEPPAPSLGREMGKWAVRVRNEKTSTAKVPSRRAEFEFGRKPFVKQI